jgi:hypothetical protein
VRSFHEHPLVEAAVQAHLSAYGEVFVAAASLESPAPVSVNNLYTHFRGKKNLTKAGRAYRDGLAAAVAGSSVEWKTAVTRVYQEGRAATLLVGLYFQTLQNRSWKAGSRTASGALSEPRKKQDSANYLKVIEDAVVQGSGIDDCNNTQHIIIKLEDNLRPRTEIIYLV